MSKVRVFFNKYFKIQNEENISIFYLNLKPYLVTIHYLIYYI